MFSLKIENGAGDQIELTNNESFDVINIEGLCPTAATIAVTEIAGFDGGRFNNAQVATKNVVITLNIRAPVEQNRQTLYRFFQVSRRVKMLYKNESRDVYIYGYVESFENNFFGKLQQPQISLICPQPYFCEVEPTITEFSTITNAFEFPFAIEEAGQEFGVIQQVQSRVINTGNVSTGGIITFTANADEILNPKVYNLTAQTFFGLDIDMQAGDEIVINTNRGEKSVTLKRAGVTSNIINDITSGSAWIAFDVGDNVISYDADVGAINLDMSVEIVRKFGGV